MIDTDKYEGHTPAPWELIEREGTGLFNLVMWRREEKKPVAYAYNSGKYTYEYPNARLMADAPKLLSEVKRLRELADNLYDFAKWMQDEKRKDRIGLQVLKDRMYWRNEE
tara:strand:- start:173 stop:502 length:330 start_codon:yes stop_codon:yes gene_type:complete